MEKKLRIGIIPYFDDGVQYIPKGYVKGIQMIGGEDVMIRYETPLEQLESIVDTLDGMLFSGGVDVDPACYGAEREPECGPANHLRDALELRLLQICLDRKMPILGICRGCQIINVGLGGTLVQDIPKCFGRQHQMQKSSSAFDHDVRIVPGTMMFDIMGGDLRVDSYHHQCVDRLADGLIPTAFAPEGFIEAYELPDGGDQFLMAVQWHPEITLDDDMFSARIFERFRQAIVG